MFVEKLFFINIIFVKQKLNKILYSVKVSYSKISYKTNKDFNNNF